MPASEPSINPIASIAANELFADLDAPVVEQAARHMRVSIVPTGETIFAQGDVGHCLYLVLAGTVRISVHGREGRQETLVLIGANDFFGEMALIDKSPRSATATAADSCLLAALDEAGFAEVMKVAPGTLSMNFVRAVVGRLRRANSHFVEEMLRNERLSLLGRMSGSIVHDFKNPMSTISLACQMLERQKSGNVAQYTGIIERSVNQMLGMTQELLDYSRGVTQLNAERVSVMTILSDLEEQSFSRMAERGFRVERSVEYAGFAWVDTQRFLRLLLNLVKNASEAMKKGGVIRFSVRAEGPWLVWQVEDTGCGMPPEILAKVFEPFATFGKSGGTGLGMTIAKSVAEAHGGQIDLESTVGVGTKVRVRIPLTPPSGPTAVK